MSDILERLATLEERVYVSHDEELEELYEGLKELTSKLNYLILALTAMFGVEFIKLLHGV